ncbi:hypothetical protein ACFFWC_12010 [Plantactinospora siamensis]|uniref:Secreted protein n=1 Tax=Plantactinospora siamensis TaxID=555372 RepID=A0ABV6P3P2_9ACTN
MFTRSSRNPVARAVIPLIRALALLGVVLASVLTFTAPASAHQRAQASGALASGVTLADRGHHPGGGGRPGGRPGRPGRPGGGGVGGAAVSPTINPAAAQIRYTTDPTRTTCASRNLCVFVLDPTRPAGTYKVFDLFTCQRYYLTQWLGTGYYNNQQTGSPAPTVYFYPQSGPPIRSFTAKGIGTQNWFPVWSIVNCQ